MRKNKTKEKLLRGEPVFGAFLTMNCQYAIDVMGKLGYDFVIIDCEHGPMTETEAETLIWACDSAGVTPIVRVPDNVPAVILRYLDRSPLGVQIPHTNTKADWERAARASRYYPEGNRGFANMRPIDVTGTVTEWARDFNRELLVIGHVEETTAVEHLDEILTVPGIDVFFVGPGDLSQSMGYVGQMFHPEVKKVVANCVKKINAAGKIAGFVSNADNVKEYMDLGVKYFAEWAGGWLMDGATRYINTARSGMKK